MENNLFRKSYRLDDSSMEEINKQNKINKLEEIFQIIEKEPRVLEKLDIEKLKIIDKYYKYKVSECKKKQNIC